ncbi:MAG: pseudouridine-5'-phosphate glycosidase, partial [bacterium]
PLQICHISLVILSNNSTIYYYFSLDISKTLEVLEAMGVPVCGFKTSQFPAFFTNDSGCRAPLEVDSALAVARMMACQDDLLLGTWTMINI